MEMRDKEKQSEYGKNFRQENKEKISKYKKEYYQKNKEKISQQREKIHLEEKRILHDFKINGCAICGYDKCDNALSFHHTNPSDKNFYIGSRNMSRKPERVTDEINKCILLCCRCHREIHEEERENER